MSTKAPQRLQFVDVLRGLAVLFMVQLHTSHGWLRPEARHGRYWDTAQFFGGLAAPMFLFLAGAGLGLRWSTPEPDPDGESARARARGLELIVLGYLLRLQMWIIDGAAYARLATYPSICLLAVSYALALLCISRSAHDDAYPKSRALGAAALWLAGVIWAYAVDPARADGLIRVDVLQCIGASLLALNLLGARLQRRRLRHLLTLAACVALATPALRRALPGPLPALVAAYLAQWPAVEGGRVISLFPLCPWLGFAAIGAAIGLLWGRARTRGNLSTLLFGLSALGAILAPIVSPTGTPMRWLAPTEPIAMLLRLTYKVSLCCAMIGPALALAHAPKALRAPLLLAGRNSLLVYWVHLEFAFGTVSRPLAGALSIHGWAVGTSALVACTLGLAALSNTRHASTVRALWRRPATG